MNRTSPASLTTKRDTRGRGRMPTKPSVTVAVPIISLSARGSIMDPRILDCPLKFLAM